VTFGHAAFFGLGAYGTAIPLVHLDIPPHLALAAIISGVGLAALGGAIMGYIALQRRGVYLALITLGLAQLLYFIFFQWNSVTGGDDGLYGIPKPTLGIPGLFVVEFGTPARYYFLSIAVFGIALLGMYKLYHSNLGRAFMAIRENEQRARYLGYNVNRLMLASFVLSAAFSGLAGSIYAFHLSFVGLSTLHWIISGEVNFFVILGGVHTFVGPAIGAGLYFVIRDNLADLVSYWQLPVGLIFIGIVLFFPDGLIGTIRSKVKRDITLQSHSQRMIERMNDQEREEN
jgi:branched-chain amino acid transport system permease protein